MEVTNRGRGRLNCDYVPYLSMFVVDLGNSFHPHKYILSHSPFSCMPQIWDRITFFSKILFIRRDPTRGSNLFHKRILLLLHFLHVIILCMKSSINGGNIHRMCKLFILEYNLDFPRVKFFNMVISISKPQHFTVCLVAERRALVIQSTLI